MGHVIVVSMQREAGRARPLHFEGIGEALRRCVAASLTRRRFARGEHLWCAGDPADHVTVLERGLVQVARTASGGKTSVVGLFGPGDPVGLSAALSERMAYPADGVVLSDFVDVLRVRAHVVRTAMAEDRLLAATLEKALIAHSSVLLAKVAVVGAGSVQARLATLFLHLADRFGAARDGRERVALELELSRSTLAGFVEARVETVIRALSVWRRSGVVRTTESGFDIDYPAMVAIIAAE